MSGLTGRAAAIDGGDERQQWAVCDAHHFADSGDAA